MLTWGMRAPSSCVSVFELAHLPGFAKSAVSCFECGGELSARLGARPRFHFAHAAAATTKPCYATAAAGEAHLQAKLHLYAQLSSLAAAGGRLTVGFPCAGCGGAVQRELCSFFPGDSVRLLKRGIGPDLALIGRDGPCAWIDVADDGPGRDRLALGDAEVPRVEIDPAEVCDPRAGRYWTPDRPLLVARHRRLLARCAVCLGGPAPLAVTREFAGPVPKSAILPSLPPVRAETEERIVKPIDIWRLFARYEPRRAQPPRSERR